MARWPWRWYSSPRPPMQSQLKMTNFRTWARQRSTLSTISSMTWWTAAVRRPFRDPNASSRQRLTSGRPCNARSKSWGGSRSRTRHCKRRRTASMTRRWLRRHPNANRGLLRKKSHLFHCLSSNLISVRATRIAPVSIRERIHLTLRWVLVSRATAARKTVNQCDDDTLYGK